LTMRTEKIDLKSTKQFPSILINYLEQKDSLKPYYNHFPAYENFIRQIEEKKFSSSQREILFEALSDQYHGFDPEDVVLENLKKLKESNSFTITTGHQLSIFTGPLYFHYKIITVINLCRELSSRYPEYNFIPLFWMATEDHDFEEISSVTIDNTKIKWETNQTGPVGKFDPASLKSALDKAPADVSLFRECYLNQPTLALSVRQYVNELYGEQGLLIIDGDDKTLKSQIKKLIFDDCCNHFVNKLAEETSSSLEKIGFRQQVFPREVNFFYLKNNFRGRIIKDKEYYKVLDSDEKWTEEEYKNLIENEPWRFSPNVLLRTLYQESILPNLAYIGGPAEIAYWLQMKTSFEHYGLSFPLLIPRNFALIIKKDVSRKLQQAGLTVSDLFNSKDYLVKREVKKHSKKDLGISEEILQSKEFWDTLAKKAASVDPTLEKTALAFGEKSHKRIEALGKKMIRAEKKKQTTTVERIEWLFRILFPNEGLQERSDNFLTYTPDIPTLLSDLIKSFDPLDFRFHIFIQE